MIKNLPFLLVVSLLTCCVEVDISVPSFPDISDYFDISDGLTQMTIAMNFLGFCISSTFYGPLSDAFGRRKVMLIGNAIMLVGAVGCTIANSIELLLFARLIQGIGASTSSVVAFAMIADTYSADKSAKLIGTMNSLITVFMSIAPIAGGFINEAIGWRGNYTTIAVISVISWGMLYLWLPETKSKFEIFSTKKIMGDFKTLMTDKTFLYASLTPSLTFAGWMSFVACGSFLYMETYNLPIMYYAIHQGVIIAAFSVCSLYCGQISKFIGAQNCVIYGSVLMLIGASAMIIVSLTFDIAPYLTSISMIIYGVGAAITYPVVFARSLELFPDISGTASSAIMAVRSLLCAIFIAVSSYIYNGKLWTVAVMILIASVLLSILTLLLLKLISFDTKEAPSE
jgi:DHA1 family bicyclomycin/chloramphenicol resistance-like MFS transporter